MSSRKASCKGQYTNNGGSNAPFKGKTINGSSSPSNCANVHQLSSNMADVHINPAEDNGWEVCVRKSKNKSSSNTGLPRVGMSNNAPKAWGNYEKTKEVSGNSWGQLRQGTREKSIGKGWESDYMAPPLKAPSATPPLPNGWQWNVMNGSSSKTHLERSVETDDLDTVSVGEHTDNSEDEDFLEDSDDDSVDYNSDVSQKSHETRKKSPWFKKFFEMLDKITVGQINEPNRQFHCPACKNGPGAIDWYKGMQPLLAHAKTKKAGRVKRHREFANLLEEELAVKGTSAIPHGEIIGKWKGLRGKTTDREIVWPPMVIVMNTLLDKDDDGKWVGMGTTELRQYFCDYDPQKAKHSYGPQGHRGMSALIFDASAVGYMEAERLHKHFADQGTDREAWNRCNRDRGSAGKFSEGGKRQLYGFLACKEDMDNFNIHCQIKSRLKFDMQSYEEKVVNELRQMNEDNQQLGFYKNRAAKKDLEKRTLQESLGVVSQKLQDEKKDLRILRERSTELHNESRSQMNDLEVFYRGMIDDLHKSTEEKEKHYESLLQKERTKAKQNDLSSGTKEERLMRKLEISKFIISQKKDVDEFEKSREELMRSHEGKKTEMRRRHLEEEVKLEKEFDTELTKLITKYSPATFEASTSCNQ